MRSIRLIVFAALAAGLSLPAAAQDRPAFAALPRDLQELFTAWQQQDCHNDDTKVVEAMTLAGAVLEAALWEAYELGPTPAAREELDSTLPDRWRLRQDWIKTNGAEAIGVELAEQLLAQSEEDFRLEEDAKLIQRWRDAALSGLGRVCTVRSIDRLQSIALDEWDPSAVAARVALETSESCSGKQ
jgi:hypothetical protein